MSSEDRPTRSGVIRRLAVAGFLASLLLVALLGAVQWSREDNAGRTSPTVGRPSAEASTPSTAPETRAEVIERLREILQIRDRAFHERDSQQLEDVYTVDCPCLEGDRSAIKELITNNYHIVGGATSIRIRRTNQVNGRLWLVVADFQSAPLRIEDKGDRLIREESGGSDLFQFALAKPAGSSDWLLGRATAYKDNSG
jgi:hypothetical protein